MVVWCLIYTHFVIEMCVALMKDYRFILPHISTIEFHKLNIMSTSNCAVCNVPVSQSVPVYQVGHTHSTPESPLLTQKPPFWQGQPPLTPM